MKNIELWEPSKYVIQGGRLMASRDTRHVALGSRLCGDLVAAMYWAHFKDHCRGRLLDLGCGAVPFFEAYRSLVDEIVCVDWGGSLHDRTFLDCQADLSKALPFADESFDTIILSDVLEHLAEPMQTWREMTRVLRVGGKVLLSVPFCYSLHEQPHDYYRYTEFALQRFARLSGLEVVVLKPTGGAPEILADILAKTLSGKGGLGRSAAWLVQQACGKFIATSFGRRASTGTARNFPFGYFMIAAKR
ncbi:MAG: class I SAM-dependent methyltransferase [Alphaproteobacteria bacterium]|nr:class I SAM-dependent methyltransferase [Alphaproteobacteria bacterium]